MDSLLTSTAPIYSLNQIILNLTLAVIVGISIAWVYKRTHRGVSYSQSFVIAIVLVSIITATIIMVIGNSLARAFGLIGAFAVIRFRTAVKDTRDISFIFFSLVEGMAMGTGNYRIAAASFILFAITIFLLTKNQFGKYTAFDYLLSFNIKTSSRKKMPYLNIFEKYLVDHLMLSFRSTAKSSQMLVTYNIRFKDDDKTKQFIANLQKSGATQIELISSQHDIDY